MDKQHLPASGGGTDASRRASNDFLLMTVRAEPRDGRKNLLSASLKPHQKESN